MSSVKRRRAGGGLEVKEWDEGKDLLMTPATPTDTSRSNRSVSLSSPRATLSVSAAPLEAALDA